MADHCKSSKCIPSAGMVTLSFEEGQYEVRRIGDEGFGQLIYGGDGEDGVLSNIGVSVFET